MSLVLLFNQGGGPVSGTAAGGNAAQTGVAFGMQSGGYGSSGNIAQQLRTYGRVGQVNGMGGTWVTVTTDADGYNDAVMLTTLCQTLKLNLGESPFYAVGIAAQQSVIQQVFPSYSVNQTQKLFAPNFASLVITQAPGPTPVYYVQVITHSGAILTATVAT
jgi:hypothetical protein